jgi:hypothetical protein
MSETEGLKYGVHDLNSDCFYRVFPTLELAKQFMEIDVIDEYMVRVEELEHTVNQAGSMLERASVYRKSKGLKPLKKPAPKKGKKKVESESESEESLDPSESDDSESEEENESGIIRELEVAKAELSNKYELLQQTRNNFRLVEIRIIS